MFSIVIPLYNEEKNIVILINEIINNLKNIEYEIILVNDASTDRTLEVLDEFNKIDYIKIFNNITNKGQSFSIHKGVLKSNFNSIITLDGDGQNNPKDILNLIKIYEKGNYQLIGGIRKNRKDSFIKIISSKIANSIRKTYLNDDCNDTGCGLKIFNKKIFLEIDFFDGMHRFLPALYKGAKQKCFFLEVDHRKRKFGKSKYGTISRLLQGIKDMIYVKNIILSHSEKKK